MLQLTLIPNAGIRETLAPIDCLKASGPHLLSGAQSETTLGEYIGRGGWRIRGKLHSLIEIDGPLVIGFEERGTHAAVGPFPNLLMAGDALFAGNTHLARYDDQDQKWHLNEAQPWTSVVIAATTPVTDDRTARYRMISEAAYYRAEKRGFAPGEELNDWLAAELHIGDVVTCPSCRQRWDMSDPIHAHPVHKS